MAERPAYRRSTPYLIWSAIAATLLVLQHLSARVLGQEDYQLLPLKDLGYYLSSWSQFDGPEYLKIAADGYWYVPGVRSPIVWFPAYPLLLRWTTPLFGDPLLAGIVVASIGGLVASGLYWRWLRVQGFERSAQLLAFLVLLTYPYAWYLYGVVHSDAVFLAAVLGAFLLVEGGRPVLAGLVGALATATRPTGLALVPALLVLSLERSGVLVAVQASAGATTGRLRTAIERFRVPVRFDRSRLSPATFGPLLALAGVGAYMLYLGVRFGNPWAFRTNQMVYHPGDRPLLKFAFLVRWRDFSLNPTYTLTITAQAIVALGVACSTPFVGRRFGWGYATFVAALVAIPTVSTEDFMGTGRYMIAAFPTAALIGEWLSTKRFGWAWIATTATAMCLLAMGFARSWYLT